MQEKIRKIERRPGRRVVRQGQGSPRRRDAGAADGRVIVESMNMAKKHTKPNPQAGKPGGIIEKEAPLAVSKVAIWNPAAKKGDRIGVKTLDRRQARCASSSRTER